MALRWLAACVVAAGIAVWAAPRDGRQADPSTGPAPDTCDVKTKPAVFDVSLDGLGSRVYSRPDHASASCVPYFREDERIEL